jgi:3-hydroxyacyl-CoA dehydrogenase/enoyl-CoA hydratase/carnithine racemase
MNRVFSFGDKTIESAVQRIIAMRRVAVIGAGTMGQGIAADLLQKTDCEVILLDVDRAALDRAKDALNAKWSGEVRGARMRPEDAAALEARTVFTQSYDDLADADIVWEAATEVASVKEKIFQTLEKTLDIDRLAAIFSNTSSHTTEELAALFSSEAYRAKFLTVHGYFPFDFNRLIDVMKGKYASAETFALGVVFADQVLEKVVMALPVDHHGYITDPIFQGMAAIMSWDVKVGQDIVDLGGLWSMFTANPFTVLDQTGHMPYTESSRHLGQALPDHDRLKSLYIRDDVHYPDWIAHLEQAGHAGVNSPQRCGFFKWSSGKRSKPIEVFDPASRAYVAMGETSRSAYWSMFEAAERDRGDGKIKSAESLIAVALADDGAGRAFRRYVLPICLYVMDLIQDGYATPGQINTCCRAGLRFKVGFIELIDALIDELTIPGVLELVHRARDENADDPCMLDMLDCDGLRGPRMGKPSLLHELKKRNLPRLLGYGKYYGTPVAELDLASGTYVGSYSDLKMCEPASRDRVASIVFNCPLRGNVFNHAVIDQLAHAYHRVLNLHESGHCGAVLFTAAGTGMRMLGADAREFNRGWFEREKGYVPQSEEDAAASSRNAVELFRMIQRSPVASVGVFGEKWGGGAEFTYFLDLRYDVRAFGYIYDTLERTNVWCEKPIYNQPELDYAILPGFAGASELKRIGVGHSGAFELFDQGMTASRAYQVGLSNAVFDDEREALRRGYERARQMAKDAPYSRALFQAQLSRDQDDAALARETGEVFDPRRNPFVRSGLVKLLDRGGRGPRMDYSCHGIDLPGWTYPHDDGLADQRGGTP